jgi:hypothetical protein
MADTRSITITLKLDKGNEEPNTSNQTQTSGGKTEENDKGSSAKALASYTAIQVGQLAVSEVIAWGEYYWNRELMLNDDYIGQRNKTIALTHINRTINNISTVGSGIASGAAVGGWVGAIIGGAISITQVAAGIIRSNVQGQEQQDIHLKQMNGQLNFTRSRAGWSTQAASIGEDL